MQRKPRFYPWVGKIPWRRKWQPIPEFLPGEFHGQTSLVSYSPGGCKESDMSERLTHTHMHTHTETIIGSVGGASWSSLVVIQSRSCVWLFATPWTAAHKASLSFTISQSFLKLMSIESVMPSNHLILCHPLLFPLSIIANIRSFLMSWLFASGVQSISPSNEYSRLISFRIDWFDLLAIQGTLKSLL